MDSIESGRVCDLMHTPDSVLASMPAMIVGNRHLKMIRSGRSLPSGVGLESDALNGRARAYGADGDFVAIMRFDGKLRRWRPDKVFNI